MKKSKESNKKIRSEGVVGLSPERLFRQGRDAFVEGLSCDKCPYDGNSSGRSDWMSGWYSEQIKHNLRDVFSRWEVAWP